MIYTEHSGLFLLINTEVDEIVDVYNSAISLLLDYPNAIYFVLV